MIRGLFLSLIIGLITGHAIMAVPSAWLENQLNPSYGFDLKWKVHIGKTTEKTSITFQNNRLLINSFGRTLKNNKDPMDGVIIVNPSTGAIEQRLVLKSRKYSNIYGVAASSTKIFLGNEEGKVAAFDWTGKKQWQVQAESPFFSAPSLADFNSDGIMDMCFGTSQGQIIALNGLNGQQLWKFQTHPQANNQADAIHSTPTLFDINDDLIRDVIVGTHAGLIYALNGKNGELIWRTQLKNPSPIVSSIFIKDRALYLSQAKDYLHKYNVSGHLLKSVKLNPSPIHHFFSPPLVTPEFSYAIGSTTGQRGAWVMPQYKNVVFEKMGPVWSTPVMADFLNTGKKQLLFFSENGWVSMLSEKGALLGKFSLPYGGKTTPLVKDIDRDGFLDIVFTTDDEFLSCYNTPAKTPPKNLVYWGEGHGNSHQTNVLYDFTPKDHQTPQKDRYLITSTALGPIELGMSYGQLKAVLGASVTFKEVDLKIGLKARAVYKEDDLQFYILYPSFETLNDEYIITILGTDNDKYHTKDGISSGALISEVAKFYGAPLFSYRSDTTYEELIQFKEQPSSFWFAHYGLDKSGDYKSKRPFNITKNFKKDSKIQFIGIKRN